MSPSASSEPADQPSVDALRKSLDRSLPAGEFLESCLAQARAHATRSDDPSPLLYFAMAALGRSTRGSTTSDAFVALFTELGHERYAEKVRSAGYTAEDLAFFWSRPATLLAPLLEPSAVEPARVIETATGRRPLPGSIMSGHREDEPFHEIDKIPEVISPRRWNLYDLEDVTYLYVTGEILVLDADGRPVVDLCTANYLHLYFSERFGDYVRSLAGETDIPGADTLDEAVVVQDLIRPPNYCHWLLDQLPRLRELNDSQHLLMYRLAPFMRDMIESMGIASERVHETGDEAIVRIGQLRIESSMGRHFYHPCQDMNEELVRFVRESLGGSALPAPPGTPRRNVYLSRNRFSRRRISNEEALLACLARHDFVTVYPEELSMQEQVVLFRDAAVIVSPHGASLANTIFCNDVTVVEIFSQNYGTPTFYLMAGLLGFRYQHLLGTNPELSDPERSRVGGAKLQAEDIEVDIERLEQCLATIFPRAGQRTDAA